jgi:hypothetical protein
MARGGTQPATLAYLDTNLVAAIRTRDLESIEQDALRQLLEALNQGRLEVVTSSVARDEINEHGDEAEREALEDIFMLMRTLTFVDEETLLWQTLRQPVDRVTTARFR